MGKPKGRNNLDLEREELRRAFNNFRNLIESCKVEDNDNLIKIRIELNGIHEILKGIDAQNKALFKLFGVVYKILTEPDKPHDKFELFNEQGEQEGGHFDPNT